MTTSDRTAPLYQPIARTAWRIAIRQRRLWWFALFAGLFVGSGFGSAIIQTLNANPAPGALSRAFNLQVASAERIAALWEQARATGVGATAALTAYGVLIIIVLATILWFAVIGVNAIVLATEHASRSQPFPPDLRARANASFWSALLVHVLTKAGAVVLLIAWGTVLLTTALEDTPIATVRGIAAFVITVFLLTFLHVLTPYAVISAVLDRRDGFTALREAFAFVRRHWRITTEASILLTAANAVAIAAWIAGSFLLAIPFFFLIGIGVLRSADAAAIVFPIGITMLAAWLAFVAVIFATFLTAAWTLLFLRLTGNGEEPQAWIARRFASR